MSVIETAAVFAGIPIAVAVVVALLTLNGGRRNWRRYRPGIPLEFQPVWFVTEKSTDSPRVMTTQSLADNSIIDKTSGAETEQVKGGASGNW